MGDAGAVGPKNLNYLSPGSVWGRSDGEGRRHRSGELIWGALRKGSVARTTEVLLTPWNRTGLTGEGWVSILENAAGCGPSGPRP